MTELLYTADFLEDVEWLRKHNKRLFEKVKELSADIAAHPTAGKGKPERLKYYAELAVYSRRIDKQNRLVYELVDEVHVKMLRCLGHYDR